jgi:carbohydrate-selective porin OprB
LHFLKIGACRPPVGQIARVVAGNCFGARRIAWWVDHDVRGKSSAERRTAAASPSAIRRRRGNDDARGAGIIGLDDKRPHDKLGLSFAYVHVSSRARNLDRDYEALGAINRPVRDYEGF